MPELTLTAALVLAGAGLLAGLINTIVGSGSLVSFPALLALGYPPVLANVTNNVGVLPGSISGAIGYRRELKGHWRSIFPLILSASIGGAAGALLLLVLPAYVFDGVVPVLIALACVLVVIGPSLKRRAAARRDRAEAAAAALDGASPTAAALAEAGAVLTDDKQTAIIGNRPRLIAVTGATGAYGGYFGAAQGVILLALLSIMLKGTMQQANAVKNTLAAAANFTATIVFLFLTPIHWGGAAIIAIGAVIGGQLGARIGRRIPETALRMTIVVVGVAAILALVLDWV